MDADNWVSKCRHMDVGGSRRPKKTWAEVVRDDLRGKCIDQEMTSNRHAWKSVTCIRPTHDNMEKRTLKQNSITTN